MKQNKWKNAPVGAVAGAGVDGTATPHRPKESCRYMA